MGRGRAKAKQTKVARQLKYVTVHSHLGALQAELSGRPVDVQDHTDQDEERDEDPYAAYLEDEDDTSEQPARRR